MAARAIDEAQSPSTDRVVEPQKMLVPVLSPEALPVAQYQSPTSQRRGCRPQPGLTATTTL
jgi:hypothetical protein